MRYLDINDDIRLIWLARFGFGKMLDDTRWIEKNSYDREQILRRYGWDFDPAIDFCDESSESSQATIESAARKYAAAQAKSGNTAPQMAVVQDLRSQTRKYVAEQAEAQRQAGIKECVRSAIAEVLSRAGSKPTIPQAPKDSSQAAVKKIVEESVNKAFGKIQADIERGIVREAIARGRSKA